MAESEDTNGARSLPDQDALDRYLEHRDRQLQYDREYLERLKQQAEVSPPPTSVAKPWGEPKGYPVCEKCSRRRGCKLLEAMRGAEGFVGLDAGQRR